MKTILLVMLHSKFLTKSADVFVKCCNDMYVLQPLVPAQCSHVPCMSIVANPLTMLVKTYVSTLAVQMPSVWWDLWHADNQISPSSSDRRWMRALLLVEVLLSRPLAAPFPGGPWFWSEPPCRLVHPAGPGAPPLPGHGAGWRAGAGARRAAAAVRGLGLHLHQLGYPAVW